MSRGEVHNREGSAVEKETVAPEDRSQEDRNKDKNEQRLMQKEKQQSQTNPQQLCTELSKGIINYYCFYKSLAKTINCCSKEVYIFHLLLLLISETDQLIIHNNIMQTASIKVLFDTEHIKCSVSEQPLWGTTGLREHFSARHLRQITHKRLSSVSTPTS